MTDERRLVSREELAAAVMALSPRASKLSEPTTYHRDWADRVFAALPQPATEPLIGITSDMTDEQIAAVAPLLPPAKDLTEHAA